MADHSYIVAQTTPAGLLEQYRLAIEALELTEEPHGVSHVQVLDEDTGPAALLPANVKIGATIHRQRAVDADRLAGEDEDWVEDRIVVRVLYRLLDGPVSTGGARWHESQLRAAAVEHAVVWQLQSMCPAQFVRRLEVAATYDARARQFVTSITFAARRFESE